MDIPELIRMRECGDVNAAAALALCRVSDNELIAALPNCHDAIVLSLALDACRGSHRRRHAKLLFKHLEKMKPCLFCGTRNSSHEHVVAEWLFTRADADAEPIRFIFQTMEASHLAPASSFGKLTTNMVCEGCNNGWMSVLENWFKERLGLLVEKEYPRLHNAFFVEAVKEKEVLARWLLKSAIIIDAASPRASMDRSLALGLFHGDMPPFTLVDAGIISDRDFRAHLQPRYFHALDRHGQVERRRHESLPSFVLTLQLNHLALRIACAPAAIPLVYVTRTGRAPLRCYPEPGNPLTADFRFNPDFPDSLHKSMLFRYTEPA